MIGIYVINDFVNDDFLQTVVRYQKIGNFTESEASGCLKSKIAD